MAEILQEKWMKGVAITTTVLAVLTAIASSRAAYCVAQAQLLTAQEGSEWAYYQAKSIKQNLLENLKTTLEFEGLGATTVDQKAMLDKTIKAHTADIARYNTEKETIKATAEGTGKKNKTIGRQSAQYALSVVFFQIGIMLSSVGALLKRKQMWIIGILFGVIALFYLANGVFLFI